MKLSLLRTLLLSGLLLLPTRAVAFSFQTGLDETVIFSDNFDTDAGWQMEGRVEISNGVLTHQDTGSYGRARYQLDQPLSLDDGAISLYWAGVFPNMAHRERDAYWASLQFADNAPVCWDRGTNDVLPIDTAGTCPNGTLRVDEDAELRVWLRPEAPTVFHRVYLDPGFIPGVDPEGLEYPLTQFRYPNHADAVEQYRLRLEQVGNVSEVSLSFWNGNDWQAMSTRRGNNPLLIEADGWVDVEGTVYDPIFEALNFQFRGPGFNGTPTWVEAVALTQEKHSTQSVPEPALLLGLGLLGAVGYRRQHQC